MLRKALVLSLFAFLTISYQLAGQTQRRITSDSNNQVRMRIANTTHPLAQSAYDIGAVDESLPMERMLLVLSMSDEQQYALTTLLDSQQTKGSPDYHHWLVPDEFGARFGAHPSDILAVTNWLQAQGFSVGSVAKNGLVIEFSGTAKQVNAAFHTQMRQYQVNGEYHIANAGDISIPAALAPVVKGVSLHNFFKKRASRFSGTTLRHNDQGSYTVIHPGATFPQQSGATVYAMGPADFAAIYDLNNLYGTSINGAGQTIAIVARMDVLPADINNFRSAFGLSANGLNIINNGPDVPFDFSDVDSGEATLDVEWSGAVAPNAVIDEVVSAFTATTDGVDLSALYIVDNNLAPVMSTSFGQCEQFLGSQENQFFSNLWRQAAAQGISAFVSTGDSGAAICDPDFTESAPAQHGAAVSGLASTPYNTAVGGTEFNEAVGGGFTTFWRSTNNPTTFESAIGYIPEKVWNDSCTPEQANSDCAGQTTYNIAATGGGVSTIYSKPSWQSTSITGVPNDGKRDLPDVVLSSSADHDPYLMCYNASCVGSSGFFYAVGGTSAAAPSFAGIMALVDQKIGSRQGLANYVLYSMAAGEHFGGCNSSGRTNPAVSSVCIFNDITVGNNGVPGNDVTNNPTAGALGYPAVTGYDLATGLGSVDGTNLVTQWATLSGGFQGSQTNMTITSPALVAGTLQITHGQSVSVNVSVQKAGGGAGPTGLVALVTNEPGPQPGSVLTVGAGQLTSGSFSGTFSNLPGGTYNLTANYPGDGVFGSSVASPIPAVVSAENSTTSLVAYDINANRITASPIQIGYGDFLAFHAVVAGTSGAGSPTGTVTFTDNGSSALGAVVLNSGAQAEFFNCSGGGCLGVGSHNVTASYSGDSSFNANGPSTAISVTVGKGTPFLAVNTVANVAYNTPASLTAVVTGGGAIAPGGTVQFLDGGVSIGSALTLTGSPSQATLNITLASGVHNITFQYFGDGNYNSAASSAPTAVTVAQPFAFSAGAPALTVSPGATATYLLTLLASNFSGTVSLTCTPNNAPTGVSCSVPSSEALSSGAPSVGVSVTVTTTTQSRLLDSPFKTLPFAFAAVFAAVLVRKRKVAMRCLLMVMFAAIAMAGMSACGGGGGSGGGSNLPPAADPTFTVTGTSGSFTNSIVLHMHINP